MPDRHKHFNGIIHPTDVGCTETDGLCLVAASGKEQGKAKKQSYFFLFHSYKSFLKLLCTNIAVKCIFTRKKSEKKI